MLDLLPGQDGEALKAWLREHPRIEGITRKRWVAFTEAAAEARQVVGRWPGHLPVGNMVRLSYNSSRMSTRAK